MIIDPALGISRNTTTNGVVKTLNTSNAKEYFFSSKITPAPVTPKIIKETATACSQILNLSALKRKRAVPPKIIIY